MSYLVMFDADRIKDFVFATGRLKEIRGGSQLVRDATDADEIVEASGIAPEDVIFAEGGSGLLHATDKAAAEELCQLLARRYRDTTHGASLTAIPVPVQERFDETVQRATRLLQLAKEDARTRQQLIQTPFTRPCQACGVSPATEEYASGDELCLACCAKRDRADQLRRRSREGTLRLAHIGWGEQFLDSLPETARRDWREVQLPETLSDLAGLSSPNNYLGFLYADGNGLGQELQKQESAAGYRRLSHRISFSLQAALWLALAQHFPHPKGKLAPFELIALGGDDIILVTLADQVVPLAITLCRLFQHISAALTDIPLDGRDLAPALAAGRRALPHLAQAPAAGRPFTLSCGIVIAHPAQPIANLEQQARELLRSAKAGFPGQAALDFHVVSTPVLRAISDIRLEEYRRPEEQTRLTVRPLRLDQADKLLDHIRAFKSGGEAGALPRSKLNALYQALFTGLDAASFEAFFLRSRLGLGQQAKLNAFFKDFDIPIGRSTDPAGPLLPWGKDTEGFFTAFGDLIELYEFTHGRASAGPDTAKEDRDGAPQG